MTLVINGGMLLAAAFFIASLAVAWVGFAYEAVPLTGPLFQSLVIAITAYTTAQFAISIALLVYDLMSSTGSKEPIGWFFFHLLPLKWAWARHGAHIGVVGGSLILMSIVIAYEGSNNGYMTLLSLLLVPIAVTLWHTTYYTMGALAIAFSHEGTSGYAIFASIEVLLWIGLLGSVSAFFLVPLVDVMQSYFSSSQNFLVAFFFVMFIVFGVTAMDSMETIAVTTRVYKLWVETRLVEGKED